MNVQQKIIRGQKVCETDKERRNVTTTIRHDTHDNFFGVGNFLEGGTNFFNGGLVDNGNQRVELVRHLRAVSRNFVKQVKIKNVRLNRDCARLRKKFLAQKIFRALSKIHLNRRFSTRHNFRLRPMPITLRIFQQRCQRRIKLVLERGLRVGINRQRSVKKSSDGKSFVLRAVFEPTIKRRRMLEIFQRVKFQQRLINQIAIRVLKKFVAFDEPLIFRDKIFY